MASREITAFLPEEHSFYDDLVTMTMSLSSLMYTLHVSYATNSPVEFDQRPLSEWMSYIKPVCWPEQPFSLPSKISDGHIILYPFWVITHIQLRGWPKFMEYKTGEAPQESLKLQIDTEERQQIASRVIGASYVSYFESVKSRIRTAYGSDSTKWPDVLNFARHVRNGFSRGGDFDVRNPDAPSITWHHWIMDYTKTGTPVLFGDESLSPGDVIWLMQDIDDALPE